MQNEEMDITWIHLLGIFEDSIYPSNHRKDSALS